MMRLGSMSYYQYVCLFVELFAVTHKSLICDVNRLVCVWLTPVRDKILFIKKLVVSQIFCTFIGDLQQVTKIFNMTTDYKVT